MSSGKSTNPHTSSTAPSVMCRDDFPSLPATGIHPMGITAPPPVRIPYRGSFHYKPPPSAHARFLVSQAAAAATTTFQANQDTSFPAAEPQCTSGICPVHNPHAVKAFKTNDSDLPKIVKEIETTMATLRAQGKPFGYKMREFLDKFYTIHGTVGNFDVPRKRSKTGTAKSSAKAGKAASGD